jgi:hypothetical protein
MRHASRLLALLFITFMILGSSSTQIVAPYQSSGRATDLPPTQVSAPAGYDSPNITAALVSPNNGTSVSGTFDITMDITSDNGPLNLTLFVDGSIYSAYNRTTVGSGNSWTQDITVDSTTLPEGMLNFTVLLEYLAEKESVYLLYFVDNLAPNFTVDLLSPTNQSTLSGVFSLDLNITSDYDQFEITVLVSGEPYAPYDPGTIGTGEVSLIIDTSSFWEGWNNITLFFVYDLLEVQFQYSMHLEFLIDNDGVPISVDHQSPANESTVSGTFDLVLLIGSDYEPLNFTLFVAGVVYPDYDNVLIGIREQTVPINTTFLDEGPLNFTMLFEYNVTGENARAVYRLVFDVNNHGAPVIEILSPTEGQTVTGVFDLYLNITSTYEDLFLNITVDGEITPEWNGTLISPGAEYYTINSSRYENGGYTLGVTAYTGEGESSNKAVDVVFLDYMKIYFTSILSHDTISGGAAEIVLRVETPYDNITASLYVDGVLAQDVDNVTLYPGQNTINLNTTVFSEGEHNVTIRGYDPFGHLFQRRIILIFDNKGAPTLRFLTTNAVLTGVARFEIEVDSDWTYVNVTVFVDGDIVPTYNNTPVDVSSGEFVFTLDVGAYSKTEHTVKVMMVTEEGDSTEISRVFGFATIRIEEIISMVVIVAVAFLIPVSRWRKGQSLKPVLIADALFILVVAGMFIVLGINTLAFLTWHINLASIWTIGTALIFTNWVIPLLLEEQQE